MKNIRPLSQDIGCGSATASVPSLICRPAGVLLASLGLCLLVLSSASAEQWRSLLVEPGVEYFTNPATRIRNGRIATIDVLSNYQKAKRHRNRPYNSAIETWTVDCGENKLALIEMRALSDAMGGGAMVFKENVETAWFAVKPGTVSEDLARAACGD